MAGTSPAMTSQKLLRPIDQVVRDRLDFTRSGKSNLSGQVAPH
jgi:hypothetical protein